MACVLLVGNVADGYTFVGPFDNEVLASLYGQVSGAEWLVVELEEPGDYTQIEYEE